jgi:hypothetical protein
LVEYDCNVSLKSAATNSATIVVHLPDGLEKLDADILEDNLFRAVLKRLKVVSSPQQLENFSSKLYTITVTTEWGFHLGRLALSVPIVETYRFSVDLGDLQQYVKDLLREHLVIRINQRTPPLPRSGPRGDLTVSMPMELTSTLMEDLFAVRPPLTLSHQQEETRRRQEAMWTTEQIMKRFGSLEGPDPEVLQELKKPRPQDVGTRHSAKGRDVAHRVPAYSKELDL